MEYGIAVLVVVVAATALFFRFWSRKRDALTPDAAAKLAARPTVPATPSWVGKLHIESLGQRGAWFEVIEGPQVGRTYFVGERTLTIGRGATHPIQLSDRDVSRSHCRITYEDGWRISDMGSGNGTWRNSVRVDAGPLEDGDRIKVGATVLRFDQETHFQVDYTLARKELGDAFETGTHSMDFKEGADDTGASMKDRLLEITRLTQVARKGLSGRQLSDEVSHSLRTQLLVDRTVVLRRNVDVWDIHSFDHARDLSRASLRILPDKPLMSRVAASGEGMGSKAFTRDEGLTCAIATPIRRGGGSEVIGVLYADRVSKEESEFAPRDLEYLEAMAGLLEPTLP